MNIRIAKTNVNFLNNYVDVIRFKSEEEQQQFFYIPLLFNSENKDFYNFNFGDGLNTTHIINSYNSIFNYNYLIVELSENEVKKYQYYFITNFEYLSGNRQVRLTLELDVFQTYQFTFSFEPCQILRKPIRMFKNNLISKSSDLLIAENVNEIPKISTIKNKIYFNWLGISESEKTTQLYDWLEKNILCWQYTFVSITDELKYVVGKDAVPSKYFTSKINDTNYNVDTSSNEFFKNGYGVIITPIYKNLQTNHIIIKALDTSKGDVWGGELSQTCFNEFWDNNNKTYIYNIKRSIVPSIELLKEDFEIDTQGNLVFTLKNRNDTYQNLWAVGRGSFVGCWGGTESYINDSVILFGNLQNINNYYISRSINIDLSCNEPKSLSYCQKLKVTCNYNTFEYDLLKINSNVITFAYNEVVTPELTKSYLRLYPQGFYSINYLNNLNGVISNNDTSLLWTNDKYSEYLANNKNFFQQAKFNLFSGMVQDEITSLLPQILNKDLSGSLRSISGYVFDTINTATNLAYSVNNMKNAPASLQNGAGDIFFQEAVDNLQPYYEIYKSTESDLKTFEDYLHAYHYSYNKFEILDISKPIFKRFNFYQAIITTYKNKKLSNIVMNKIIEIFSKGVRVWENVENIFDLTLKNEEVEDNEEL